MTTELVITPAVAGVRRRLGPTAWIVLEELLLGCEAVEAAGDAMRSSMASVRALAERLGLDKDTVARSIQRLIAADVVRRLQSRTGYGIFARATYLIRVPDGVGAVDCSTPLAPVGVPFRTDASSTSSVTSSRVRRDASARARLTRSSLQLSLLDN